MNLKEQVEVCLREVPSTRDSDITLTVEIWQRYYPRSIVKDANGDIYVRIKDLYHLPREDGVKRYRAKFNEQGKYLTSNPQIRKQRKQKEVEWRQELGYNN